MPSAGDVHFMTGEREINGESYAYVDTQFGIMAKFYGPHACENRDAFIKVARFTVLEDYCKAETNA